MKKFTLKQVAEACNGKFVGDEKYLDYPITSVERDSREIKEGSLFLAIKGARVDGHGFIEKCYERGAICALCEKAPENPQKPYILVNSTLDAVKQIAESYRGLFDIPVIGISGSVGKTSTKEMIASVLSQKFKVHKTMGNLNNELGVPLTLFGLEEEHQAAVIEMGISDFGEMQRISKMVKPTICVITIIGSCHLENLGNRDGVLKAKTEMFENMTDNAKIILNGDDDKLNTVKEVRGIKPEFYGLNSHNKYYAVNIQNNGTEGVDCTLCFNNTKLDVTIPALGNYMVSNALAAVAVGKSLGLSDEQLISGVESYKTVGSRANLIKAQKVTIIDDCYNANPNSVKAAVDTLANFSGRKVAVLGDMKELGKTELQLHNEIGEYAVQKKIDIVIAVGPLAKEIFAGAENEKGTTKAVYFETIEKAQEKLKEHLKEGDTVLVKASHSMQFEKIVNYLKQI